MGGPYTCPIVKPCMLYMLVCISYAVSQELGCSHTACLRCYLLPCQCGLTCQVTCAHVSVHGTSIITHTVCVYRSGLHLEKFPGGEGLGYTGLKITAGPWPFSV